MDTIKSKSTLQKPPAPQSTSAVQNAPAVQTITGAVRPKKHTCWQLFIGLLFVLLLPWGLMTYGGYIITSERVMKPMITKTLNAVFRQEGMEEVTRVVNYVNELYKHKDELKAMQKLDPAKVKADMNGMSPEQSQKYLEENLVKPMYENGTKIIEPMKAVNPNAAIDAERLDFLSSANLKSNGKLRVLLIIEGIILLLELVILILISNGWARVYVPGIVILLGSLPGLVMFSLSDWLIARFAPGIMGQYAKGPLYNELLKIIVYPAIEIIRNIHLWPVIGGVGLIILGVIFALVFKPRAQTR